MPGVTVAITSALGKGFPDIVVGCRKKNFLFEIKDGDNPPSAKRLTEDEGEFHAAWAGQIDVIESVEDAMRIIFK